MSRKWQGTALFAVIMAGVSATVAGRMFVSGPGGDAAASPAAPTGSSSGSSDSSTAPSDSSTAPSDSSSAPTSSSSGSSTSADGTVTGSVEQTRFGPVQVSVTFSGSKITAVTTLEAPSGRGRDQMLTQYATPLLAKEVIASQSARVDTISGATYTSEGYLESVQSAIDSHK